MNQERLLKHFDRIAEAPDAVPRLRRFILDLAVRGKLVEQDSGDEPASALLKRIQAEKSRLVKEGEIRKPKPLPAVDEPQFALPSSWRWTRMRDITSDRGQKVPDATFTYIDVTAINKEAGVVADAKVLDAKDAPSRARKITRKGDVIYSCVRPYLLNVAVIEEDFDPEPIASTAFAILNGHGFVLSRYLWIVLRSPFMVECVEEDQRGQAYPAINDADFAVLPFPLPPLAEQHRIVAKVDELMALCDQLEAAQIKREQRRDRLAAASLNRINQPASSAESEAALREHTRFHLIHFPRLTTRPEHLKTLRQTILNLAVRGRLVPQDPNDESALELIKRVKGEKARLVQEGVIKKEKQIASVTDETKPYAIPKSWQWVRLDGLCQLITKGSSPKWQGVNYVNAADGLLFVTSENVGNYELRKLDHLKYVESRFKNIEPRSMLRRGDILMNLVGASIGRTALYDLDVEANINQAVALLRLVGVPDRSLVVFLLHYLNSPTAVNFMLGSRVIAAQPNISLTDAREFPIPLPPPAEQHRIVTKVDELMAVCDQLEANLTTTQTDSRRLLEAVLRDALAPALEAAACRIQ